MVRGIIRVSFYMAMFCCILSTFHITAGRLEETVSQKAVDSYEGDEWNIAQGKHCVVYYKKSSEEAGLVLRAADNYYPMVAADFSWEPAEKPIFILYHDKKAMALALGLEETAPLPMGAYKGGRIAILSPLLWAAGNSREVMEAFLEKGPISHELVHFAMDDTVNGSYPPWLGEGLALYYEKKYTGFEWRPDLQSKSRHLSQSILATDFQKLPVALAYRKSYELVRDYVTIHGEPALQKYIAEISE